MYIYFIFFIEISLDISCELSSQQTIHMKCKIIFLWKKKIKSVVYFALTKLVENKFQHSWVKLSAISISFTVIVFIEK